MNDHFVVEHKSAGKFLEVNHHKAFVFDKGEGVPVVCFHGVPASSYLYRRVIDRLAANKVRGISFDLIGMGLSDRPLDYDYSWTGLGNWSVEVIKKLNLGKFHVVLHDIGGPIACEVMAKIPEQILSVTILNTMLVNLPRFQKPFPMWFFPYYGIGEIFVAMTNAFMLQKLMHFRGINKKEAFGLKEAKTYLKFLKGNNRGKSFLKIMRGFEATKEKEKLYLDTLIQLNVPKQIIWGETDKGLTYKQYGLPFKEVLGITKVTKTKGSHFLQEDYSEVISDKLLEFI